MKSIVDKYSAIDCSYNGYVYVSSGVTISSFKFAVVVDEKHPLGKHADVYGAETLSKYRGKGYMRELMESFFEHVVDSIGLDSIYLNVYLDNEPAIGLYKSLGFITCCESVDILESGEKRFYITMIKRLNRSENSGKIK